MNFDLNSYMQLYYGYQTMDNVLNYSIMQNHSAYSSPYQTMEKSIEKIRNDLEDPDNVDIHDHSYYYIKCGKVNDYVKVFEISDPNCEYYIYTYTWPIDYKYFNFFSDSLLDFFFLHQSTLNEFIGVLIELDDTECMKFVEDNSKINEKFHYKGLKTDDILMMIYAIRTYTGDLSMIINRTFAHDLRMYFLVSTQANPILNQYSTINSYMLRGLYYLPIHFGICTRCVNLSSKELNDYSPGNIVTWFQFSSSTVGKRPLNSFTNRNAILYIYSISGRNISDFSKYKEEEEVIFLPFSQFLVLKVETHNDKPLIHLRQIELGISKKNILWVDESIFSEPSSVKYYLDYASIFTPRTRFILKTSYDSALTYLQSYWGQKKKESLGFFRVIINSSLPNHQYNNEAGVRFCYQAIDDGFRCKYMIYTTDNIAKTQSDIRKYNMENCGVQITNNYQEIFNFVTFK